MGWLLRLELNGVELNWIATKRFLYRWHQCSGQLNWLVYDIKILDQLNQRFSLLLSQCDLTGLGRGGLGGEEKISETITYYCIFILSLLLFIIIIIIRIIIKLKLLLLLVNKKKRRRFNWNLLSLLISLHLSLSNSFSTETSKLHSYLYCEVSLKRC